MRGAVLGTVESQVAPSTPAQSCNFHDDLKSTNTVTGNVIWGVLIKITHPLGVSVNQRLFLSMKDYLNSICILSDVFFKKNGLLY